MRCSRIFSVVLAGLLLAGSASAQEKPKAASEQKSITPLRVQVVFSETEGEKKTASMPYTLLVSSGAVPSPTSSLRMGLRIPILTEGKESKIQYTDVGTYIDCHSISVDEGRFQLFLSFERSSIFTTSGERKQGVKEEDIPARAAQPIIQNFRGSLNLLMRDGQTVQSVVATDPLSGRVLKLDVTLTVVK